MLVDARHRFAERVANWLGFSKLNARQITDRLNTCFDDDFIQMVVDASNSSVAK